MSLCIIAGGKSISIAVAAFTLSWTHSVQKTEWREDWEITPAGLHLRQAAIRGSGAGMEPGPDARLQDGFWVWAPQIPPIPQLTLAASGATGSGWTLCHANGCIEQGREAGDTITLRPCH